jgi:uncharacterized membrane protein YqaE (UPF0057 family)
MENKSELICPSCKSTVSVDAYFCPNCGKQLKDKPPATTLSKQIIIYSVSLFLPPFGLWYAWKYLKYGDYKSRKIGIIAVILTIISILITIWLTEGFISSATQSLNEINNLNL